MCSGAWPARMADFPSAETLRRKVEAIPGVATLPHVMARILELVDDESSSATDLGAEIAADTSLTAKLLKIVNSAFYGFPRQIAQVSEAVVVLGYEEIKRISLATSVIGMFGDGSPHEDGRLRFWTHSLHTAALAELLEREGGRGGKGAFTAGVLHDLGRIVLDQFFPEINRAIEHQEAAENRTPVEIEQELLGVTHADIGYWLAERWNLPPVLAEAIQLHHRPKRATEGTLAAAVHVADVLVHRMSAAEEPTAARRRIQIDALETLGLDSADLRPLQKQFTASLQTNRALVQELMAP